MNLGGFKGMMDLVGRGANAGAVAGGGRPMYSPVGGLQGIKSDWTSLKRPQSPDTGIPSAPSPRLGTSYTQM